MSDREYIISMYCADRGIKCEEVVRCRDCKYASIDQSDHDYREPLWCGFHMMDVKQDGFCAWGRRKVDA